MKRLFKRYGSFVVGIVVGAMLFAGITALAVGEIIGANYAHESSVIFDGEVLELPVPLIAVVDSENPGFLVNYMPVRGVLEAMGYIVTWDPDNNDVLVDTPIAPPTGAFSEDRDLTEEDLAVFEEAMQDLTGVDYEPLKVATQVVAGTNYRFLCNATVVYPDAETTLKYVFIYLPLDGDPEIIEIVDVEED